MAAKYRKVDPRVWNDEKFRQLSPDDKLVALYCLTCDQTNRIGLFVFSVGKAAEDIGLAPDDFTGRFDRVCETLSWRWDRVSRTLYFPMWWKYNAPDNGKHMLGCLQDLHDIPRSPFLQAFCDNTQWFKPPVLAAFEKGMPYPMPYPMYYSYVSNT